MKEKKAKVSKTVKFVKNHKNALRCEWCNKYTTLPAWEFKQALQKHYPKQDVRHKHSASEVYRFIREKIFYCDRKRCIASRVETL